jgi:hypothetical protein
VFPTSAAMAIIVVLPRRAEKPFCLTRVESHYHNLTKCEQFQLVLAFRLGIAITGEWNAELGEEK